MNLLCLVVDDEIKSLGYLTRYIQKITVLNLVKVTDNALEAKAFIENNNIDLLITDIDMPYFTGFELYELFKTKCKVIFITAHLNQVQEALYKNAVAVLLKPFSFEQFKEAVENAFKIINFDKMAETNITPILNIDCLGQREKEVFLLIGEGKSSQEISDLKFVSLKTVENHRQNIRRKLNLTGKHSLTLFAAEYVKNLK